MRDIEKRRANQRRYYHRHKDKYQTWAKANRVRKNAFNILYRQRLKLAVLTHYGGNPPHCACCGETHIEFLTLDHITGQGNKLRGDKGGGYLYNYVRTNDYPLGYRVLCLNCNFSIGHFGYCPHQKKE